MATGNYSEYCRDQERKDCLEGILSGLLLSCLGVRLLSRKTFLGSVQVHTRCDSQSGPVGGLHGKGFASFCLFAIAS